MKRSNKHAVSKVNFSPLNGGINVSQPPEQIGNNEMQVCENFIYDKDSQRLVGRGGLKKVSSFDSNIKSMYYDMDTNQTFVFLENRDCYMLILSSTETKRTYLDKVTGKGIAKCEKFKDKLFVATGELLQFYDYSEDKNYLQAITDGPVCDDLFYRWGRLMVTMSGSDRITYSSVGDASSDVAWKENTNDPSSSKWIDIGPDDSGDIINIVPLATDIIVFKSNGKAYQFVGDSSVDTWSVYNVANFTDLTGNFTAGMAASNIGNQVVFLSLRGLKTLSATMDYGNIASADIGDKFNKLITDNMYEPAMYNLRRHKMLIIRPTADKKYFVAYNYSLNSATVIKFGFDVEYILETKDDVFVASKNNIYLWSNEATQDDTTPIEYVIKPKQVLGSDEMLVKAIDTKFNSDRAGDVNFSIGERLNIVMPANSRRKVLCNHSTDIIDISVRSNTRFELDHIYLDMAEL